MTGEDPANMALWAPWVRAFVVKQELLSRFYAQAFTAPADGARGAEQAVSVFHLVATPGSDPSQPPAASYEPFVTAVRPHVPDFGEQLDLVASYADLRSDRTPEVLTQISYPTTFFGGILGLHPARHKYVLEVVAIVQAVASTLALRVKHALACQRPDRYSSQIQAIIPTPGHGTLPSGHSVEAFATAMVLQELLPNNDPGFADAPQMLMRQAERIAANRTVGGVHFPVDSLCGASLGLALGDMIAHRAGKPSPLPVRFDGRLIAARDFQLDQVYKNNHRASFRDAGLDFVKLEPRNTALGQDVSQPLKWMWDRAKAELQS